MVYCLLSAFYLQACWPAFCCPQQLAQPQTCQLGQPHPEQNDWSIEVFWEINQMHLNNWFKFLRKNSDDEKILMIHTLLSLSFSTSIPTELNKLEICLMFHFSYVNPDPELFPRFRFICFRSCKKRWENRRKLKLSLLLCFNCTENQLKMFL